MTPSSPVLYAGTSGFSYASWKPDFYPAKLAAAKFLEYYGGRLNCVEINYTFRTIAAGSTLDKWIKATPDAFLFCPKAHMRLTHIFKLRDAEVFTQLFLKSLEPLRIARKLGPILFQLPPTFKADPTLLAGYLALLPRDLKFAFEFRHNSWLTEDVFAILREHNVAVCVAESEDLKIPETITASFVYFRLRKENYLPEERASIAARMRSLLLTGRDLFVFYKHEDTPEGALNAEELLQSAR